MHDNPGPIHLAKRNPQLVGPHGPRFGCWNTVMLTACDILSEPEEVMMQSSRPSHSINMTLLLSLCTCKKCLAWAECNPEKLRDGVML